MSRPYGLAGLVQEISPKALELRDLLHRNPEPAHREHRTTELIRRFVEGHGLEFNGREPKTGGWVDLGDDPLVGFRADIDALPILEPTENSPRSQTEGWMHACGNDAHAAIAAGIAVVLARLDIERRIRIIFQPAEEVFPGGAVHLVEEGGGRGALGFAGLPCGPDPPVGSLGGRIGPITAGADALTIAIHGPGGHTSRPSQDGRPDHSGGTCRG